MFGPSSPTPLPGGARGPFSASASAARRRRQSPIDTAPPPTGRQSRAARTPAGGASAAAPTGRRRPAQRRSSGPSSCRPSRRRPAPPAGLHRTYSRPVRVPLKDPPPRQHHGHAADQVADPDRPQLSLRRVRRQQAPRAIPPEDDPHQRELQRPAPTGRRPAGRALISEKMTRCSTAMMAANSSSMLPQVRNSPTYLLRPSAAPGTRTRSPYWRGSTRRRGSGAGRRPAPRRSA